MAYDSEALQPLIPLVVWLRHGLMFQSVSEVCVAASWATPHTFTTGYKLDVRAPTVGLEPNMPI